MGRHRSSHLPWIITVESLIYHGQSELQFAPTVVDYSRVPSPILDNYNLPALTRRGQLLQLSPPWDNHMAVNAATSTRCLQDEEGAARRRRRRRQRDHGPDSAHSYYSVVSEGGTRHVRRRRKRGDGTYSSSESYHSDDSEMEGGGLAKKKVHC